MSIKKDFYPYLEENNQLLVDKIDNHEILGASAHISIISDLFIDVVENNMDLELEKLLSLIENIKDYYFETRGNSSIAIVNGINQLLNGVFDIPYKDSNHLLTKLKQNVNKYNEFNNSNLEKIMEYSVNELKEYQNILLYDYSSTVEKAVTCILRENDRKYNIFISESSAIDGGSPYLELGHNKNANLYFFPDSVLAHYIKKSDCCLMGAEAFYPDGTGFNTIGSDIVSIISDYYKVPLYFLTPMNKLDNRRIKGIKKDRVLNDFRNKYKNPEKLEENVNTIIPELVGVEPEYIKSFITEDGVIPSDQIFVMSMRYLDKMKEELK